MSLANSSSTEGYDLGGSNGDLTPNEYDSMTPCRSSSNSCPSSPAMDEMRASVIDGFIALEVLNKKADDVNANGHSTDEIASTSRFRSFVRSIRSRSPSRQRTQSPSASIAPNFVPASPRSPLAKVSEEESPDSPVVLDSGTIIVTASPSPVVKSRKRVSTLQLPTTIQQPQMWISNVDGKAIPAAYNEYGELVDLETLSAKPLVADEHTITEILRKIKTEFQAEFRAMMREIILPQIDSRTAILDDGSTEFSMEHRLLSWGFSPGPSSVRSTPDGSRPNVAVFDGPPRVLEVGCCDGNWAFKMKKEQPGWIVEGLDDYCYWSRRHPGLTPRDFMAHTPSQISPEDYFSRVPSSQDHLPSFTVRNINQILDHSNPLPNNLYDLIRGRDVFDRVENYKSFLDAIRLILKPDGVVEFIEVDPRPRFGGLGQRLMSPADHTSRAATTWTDSIPDRFVDQEDDDIAVTVPGWTKRIAERLKARIRPNEDVAGPNLKSWLQGAGFWDVKQSIRRLPVGGNSRIGQLLQRFILYRVELEDSVPKLKEALPELEIDAIESGQYFLNLHIITGRKPKPLRAGHLLLDGSRQEMTESKYEAMARANEVKHNQWRRLDSETNLISVMGNISDQTEVLKCEHARLARDLGLLAS